jgi:hypothetical protein
VLTVYQHLHVVNFLLYLPNPQEKIQASLSEKKLKQDKKELIRRNAARHENWRASIFITGDLPASLSLFFVRLVTGNFAKAMSRKFSHLAPQAKSKAVVVSLHSCHGKGPIETFMQARADLFVTVGHALSFGYITP